MQSEAVLIRSTMTAVLLSSLLPFGVFSADYPLKVFGIGFESSGREDNKEK